MDVSPHRPQPSSGRPLLLFHDVFSVVFLLRGTWEIGMWFESLPPGKTWTSLWSGYILCPECRGIRSLSANCPACDTPIVQSKPEITMLIDGQEVTLPAMTYAGAEGRYEDYVFLALMEREWNRPLAPTAQSPFTSGMSERAGIVLLFWTYFETRMIRLVTFGASSLPQAVQEDLFRRYDSVTAHMKSLYSILFGVTYQQDLIAVGAESVSGHLDRIKDARNRFVHGDPSVISDSLVEAVVHKLKDEHEAWIAVFNRRIAAARASRNI